MSWKATAFVKPITHDSRGRRLVSSEKLLLLILADYHNEERGYAWVSVSRMATEALLSERQCIRVLASLEARKLITVERRQGATCLYRFCGVRSEKLCWYCGCELYEDNKTQDHQLPVSRGGRGGKNLVLACRSCNGQKHGRTVEEYRAECFPPGHKFFGETNDKLSYVENVEPLTLTREGVTNKPKKQGSMSPEPPMNRQEPKTPLPPTAVGDEETLLEYRGHIVAVKMGNRHRLPKHGGAMFIGYYVEFLNSKGFPARIVEAAE